MMSETQAVAGKPTVRYAREVRIVEDYQALLASPERIAEARANFLAGDLFIVKRMVAKEPLVRIRDYLVRVGQNSFPTYQPIAAGAPNFHRITDADPRSDVLGVFHQFVFYPWNQDVFQVFKLFEQVYRLKNMLSDIPEKKYLGPEPVEGCTARVAFQFYPSGGGMLNRHSDPVGYHQLVVPTIVMSQRGEDFAEGGLFVEKAKGQRVDVEAITEIGDAVYFNAEVVHGVAPVDPGESRDWLSFKGRWMGLIAVNRLQSNNAVARSLDLDRFGE